MVDGFTADTGIKVEMRSGDDFELANQIVQEGRLARRRLHHRELAGNAGRRGKGLFAPVDGDAGAGAGRFTPADGTGSGSRPLDRAGLQHLDAHRGRPAGVDHGLADLEWKGRVGIAAPAPTSRRSPAPCSRSGRGRDRRLARRASRDNAKVYQGNGAVMKAVNDGEIPAGIIYHYYWYKDQAESGANSDNTQLHFFGNQDPGGFVSVSGVGVLKSSEHPDEAQQLVAYITGRRASRSWPTAPRWSTRSTTASPPTRRSSRSAS